MKNKNKIETTPSGVLVYAKRLEKSQSSGDSAIASYDGHFLVRTVKILSQLVKILSQYAKPFWS